MFLLWLLSLAYKSQQALLILSRRAKLPLYAIALLAGSSLAHSAPTTFAEAKREMVRVYADKPESFYCACTISWFGDTAAKPKLETCGYEARKTPERAHRIEWEHVVPAHTFGQQRSCWRQGGRSECTANDHVFRQMEADMHNLVPAIGEVNGDRSNFRFGVLPQTPHQYGQCLIKIDFKQRVIEPRREVRGDIARINFYMYDRYALQMSRQQQQLLLAWHHQDPVSDWELIRNERITQIMGFNNEYITGAKIWSLQKHASLSDETPPPQAVHPLIDAPRVHQPIRGNRNSKVYHLPSDCPSYNAMKPSNIVEFRSEDQASKAGYRRAGNCR